MPAKKVFLVVGSFKLGGTERTASRIGLELVRRGYDVRFIILKSIFDYNDENLISKTTSLKSELYPGFLKIVIVYVKLMLLLVKHRPSYLISFSIGINVLLSFTFYPRIIFRIETNPFVLKRRLYRKPFQKYFSRFPNIRKVVIPSRDLLKACSDYFGINSKLVQISNPIDIENIQAKSFESIEDYSFLKEKQFVVSAGRLGGGKGFLQLIRIFSISSFPIETHLVVLGDGPQYEMLNEEIIRLGLQERIHLIGFQRNPYRFFSKAKYLVLNSSKESFGNVLIEAFACGIPVVSNDCDFGPRDIIQHGENGLLYNQEEDQKMKEALEAPFWNESLYIRIKAGANASKEQYHVKRIVDFWEKKVLT